MARRSNRARLTALLALAASGATICTAAAASARHGAYRVSATPPVITEHFTPLLPCDPSTTVGMEGCGEHRVIAADARLNADVKVIFDLLDDARARLDFGAAQAAWLTYRNADCRSQSDVYSGGSEQPVVYVDCLAGDDSARRTDLKGFFRALTQGLGSVPKFP